MANADQANPADALLEERRRIFTIVRTARRPVGRDDVARAAGIRKVGRKPKLYEPSSAEVRISIPPRQPDLLAEILVDAAGATDAAKSATFRSAAARGNAVGVAERTAIRPGRLSAERVLTLAARALERWGFEPYRDEDGRVRLRNCPFHPLTERDRQLVCGLNHAFVEGVLTGLGASSVLAVLGPDRGHCCVELYARPTPRGRG